MLNLGFFLRFFENRAPEQWSETKQTLPCSLFIHKFRQTWNNKKLPTVLQLKLMNYTCVKHTHIKWCRHQTVYAMDRKNRVGQELPGLVQSWDTPRQIHILREVSDSNGQQAQVDGQLNVK